MAGPNVRSADWRGPLERRLRWGAGSKLTAEVVGRALQFLLIYLAQRTLGPATYGEFTYALAVGFVLAPLTDLGIQLIVTREMAREPSRFVGIAGAGLALKVILACCITGLVGAVSLTRPPAVQTATFLLGLAMVLGSFAEFFGYTFRGLQRVEYEAVLTLVMRVAIVGAGLWALWHGMGLMGLAGAYVLGSGLGAAVGFVWLRKRFFTPSLAIDLSAWRTLLYQALPLGGAIVLSIAFTRTPVFLLDAMRGPEAVGLYGVAQKLTEPFAMIPAALMAAVFPAFTQGLAHGTGQAGLVRARSMRLLVVIGAAIAGAGVLGGPWLIKLLYGSQYAGSERPLQVLALGVLLTFMNYALTHFIIALDRQDLNLLFNAIIFVLNLALCLALIPRFGPVGAAGAALLSEGALFALCRRALSPWMSEPAGPIEASARQTR